MVKFPQGRVSTGWSWGAGLAFVHLRDARISAARVL